ncbi:hypothetical protein GPALN_014859 [Globodera pallida]|nr:hypothetical protein GPALN_014859 [Globodera pallida]
MRTHRRKDGGAHPNTILLCLMGVNHVNKQTKILKTPKKRNPLGDYGIGFLGSIDIGFWHKRDQRFGKYFRYPQNPKMDNLEILLGISAFTEDFPNLNSRTDEK